MKRVSGSKSKSWVTTHGLLGIPFSLLFVSGHSHFFFALQTRHCSPKSLLHHHNFQRENGKRQEHNIIGSDDYTTKRGVKNI